MSDPPARCLDVTRLISRMGRGPLTGVDRVELAYLRHLSRAPVPVFLLARTALGHVLAGPGAAADMLRRLDGEEPWGPPDLIGRLSRRAHPLKRRAEADLRRHAVGRCTKGRLAKILRRKLPEGASYVNVGHSNLSEEVLTAWRSLPGASITVLIHDTIPLDHPQFQRPGTVDGFRGRLTRVACHAHRAIYATQSVRADAERWMQQAGRVPAALVAPLGVEIASADAGAVPGDLPLDGPFFLTVGTIEPRKNHALLLDVWERLGESAPPLVIAGRRGWNNEAVFEWLDTSPLAGRTVFERGDLSDGAISALMERATALLMPSRAEGYGLPPIEAAAHQLAVISTDLPVYREILGDKPVYLNADDAYAWVNKIAELTEAHRAGHRHQFPPFHVPSWAEHFNDVLKVV